MARLGEGRCTLGERDQPGLLDRSTVECLDPHRAPQGALPASLQAVEQPHSWVRRAWNDDSDLSHIQDAVLDVGRNKRNHGRVALPRRVCDDHKVNCITQPEVLVGAEVRRPVIALETSKSAGGVLQDSTASLLLASEPVDELGWHAEERKTARRHNESPYRWLAVISSQPPAGAPRCVQVRIGETGVEATPGDETRTYRPSGGSDRA